MKPTKTVDEYIAQIPEEWRGTLEELRAAIMTVAPLSTERISYAMPSYHYKGRLVYFSFWKTHIGIYGLAGEVKDQYVSQLKGYEMDKGTIRFPLDQKLPLSLIKKLVKAQLVVNEEAEKK